MNTNLVAQVTADFVVLQDSGCVPFIARFSDSSSAGITYRHWDFGNGNVAVGNNPAPSATYNGAGLFDVTLTVSDGVDTVSVTKLAVVSVFNNPTASFSNQNVLTGCVEFPFQVFNTSTIGAVPITSWQWDFDDGSPLFSGQNTTHVYNVPGTYTVTLIVTDSLGCSSSKVKSNLVTPKPKPVASFYSNDSLSVCGPPLTVNIVNTSTSSHPMSYNWLVGGTSYNSFNVSSTFTASGGYDAQLIVNNTIGCSDTLTIPNYVWIGTIYASMDVVDTTCLNVETEFINTSHGGTTFNWDFGDGFSDVGDTVEHIYTTPGLYTVTLVSSSGSICDDTTTQDVYVEKVQANFSSTPHTACQVPLAVTFTDLTMGNIAKWEWRFGNVIGSPPNIRPNKSFAQNPINSYWTEGTFDDTLIVTTVNGCIDTLVVPVNEEIIITKAGWSSDVVKGCLPLDVDFTNTTDSINRMANWWWDFDDGSPLTSTLNPSHTFNVVGVYNVSLTVVSIDGCTTDYVSEIRVGSHQTPAFAIDTLTACTSDSVGFINNSIDTSLIDEYIWLFGDGESKSDFEPKHLYVDTGYLDVTLITYFNGCADTLIVDSAINILGPIVDYYLTYNCDSQNVVEFHPMVIGGTNFMWNFGDSSAMDSSNWTTSHAYPIKDTNYVVELTVWDSASGCSQSLTDQAQIRYLTGRVTAGDTTICRYDNVVFNTGNSTNAIAFVKWSMDGLTTLKVDNSNTDFNFMDKGPQTVIAIVMDAHGCLDTAYKDVYVYEPIVNFSSSPNIGCAPSVVQFSDLSQSDTAIASWNWDFGNGRVSTLQNPSQTYNGNGTTIYDITLSVVDVFGCSNDLFTPSEITVVEPPSFFTSTDVEMCEFEDIAFSNQPVGNYSYFWDFGDGGTSWVMNPNHQYTQPGFYDVSLTVMDSLGCDSTYARSNYIEVQDTPEADFISFPTFTDCYPASILFSDQSTYQNLDYWTWNFGDSPNNVILYTAGAQNLYNAPGYYDITLVLTTTFGCTDTIIKNNYIHIGGPTGQIAHSPDIGCVGQDVIFTADSINGDAQRFIWDFGDGYVDTVFAPVVSINHVYTNPGFYNVTLFITDDQGLCQLTDTTVIEIDLVEANFIMSDSLGCAPLQFEVQNISIGEDEIYWFLNGDSYSQSQTDSFLLKDGGAYEISLIVVSSYSQCADTMIAPVKVNPNPTLNLPPDAVICFGDSLGLNATGAYTYTWTPSTYLSSTNVPNPTTLPSSDITYYVTALDTNGCEGSDSINILVQQKPDLTFITPDTSIFIGADLQLNTTTTLPVTYIWTPKRTMGCNDCPNPYVQPSVTTTYTLVYQDLNGCFVLDTTVTVEVLDEFKVSIPNTFTPGSDGLNDTFVPVIYGVEELMYMRIFDRWGSMVYETEDITLGWDGTHNGERVADNSAFSYTVKVRRFNGEIKEYVGVVIVLINGL